ncbi:Calcium-binding protein 39-like [Hondaea fermentalgiana]|uniref:Calcium-binding protein 39-like n=1 Tax=Hondaea fermentalgiana TaxID=2315210 RepID=A0A2R5G3Q9_9STRA|nr:Calcium-binding protein 39-like [Hondaea fermentalgiana]|eukprot:GBG24959.1 Calcium-binding protein 39-like [Hondaea fermentalgiana]
MAFMFKKKKSPQQLTNQLVEALRSVSMVLTRPLEPGKLPPLSSSWNAATISQEDNTNLETVGKRLVEVRSMMCGTTENQPRREDNLQLATSLQTQGVPLTLIQNLGVLPFEARNDAVHILSYMIHGDLGQFATKYLRARSQQVIRLLVDLFADSGVALHCGSLLRDCLRYEFLAAEFFEPSCWAFDKFFDQYLVCESFDISSDAFATFRDVLTIPKLKPAVYKFLVDNYDHFFAKYNKLLVSDQYVTQRQSLKLLGELLLDRQNYNVMMNYISDRNNLKLIMTLMRVKSPAIQMEAFHVFKVFVANPRKSEPVAQILSRNRDKIISYLANLNADNADQQFIEERNLLTDTLSRMPAPAPKAAEKPPPAADGAEAANTSSEAPTPAAPPAATPDAPPPAAQADAAESSAPASGSAPKSSSTSAAESESAAEPSAVAADPPKNP